MLNQTLDYKDQKIKELSQKIEEMTDFVENASVALHWEDEEGKILWANKTELDILGYTLEEFIGRPVSDFHIDKEAVTDMKMRVSKGETLRNYPAQLICKDGSIRHVIINSNVYRKDGKFIHTRCFTRDITEIVEKEQKQSDILRELERKNVQIKAQAEELKKERETLLNFFTNAPANFVILKGPEHRFEYLNPLAQKESGNRLLVGKTVREVFPELKGQGYFELLDNVYKTGEPCIGKEMKIYIDKNGLGEKEELFINFSYQAMKNSDGEIEGILVFSYDITDMVMARRDVEASEEKYRNLLQGLPAAVYTCDTEGYIQMYNKAAAEIWGCEPVIDKDLWCGSRKLYKSDGTFLPLEECPVAIALQQGVIEETSELIIERPDGERRHIIPHPQLLLDASGKTTGLVNTLIDVTEQINARKKIEIAELRTRLALDAAKLGNFDWDLQTQKFMCSRRAVEIFGFDDDVRVSHQELINAIHPNDLHIRNKAVSEAFQTGWLTYEARIIHPDQSIHWIKLYGKIIFDDNNKPLRMYGIVSNIDEQKRFMEQMEQKVLERTHQLNQSRAILQSVLNTTKNVIASYEAIEDEQGHIMDFKILYCNDEVYSIIDKKPEEIIGETCKKIFPTIFEDGVFEKLVRCITTGEPDKYELQYFKNKQVIWFEASIIKLNNNSVTVTSNNITEEKNAEMQLENLNKQLIFKNELFTHAEINSGQGSYSWNLVTGESTYSDNFYRLLGYSINEFTTLRDNYQQHIHPDDFENVMSHLNHVIETGENSEWEFRMVAKNKEIIYTKSTGTIINTLSEKILVGTIQDISKEKKAALLLEQMNGLLSNKNKELEHQILHEFSESFSAYKTGDEFFNSLVLDIAYKTKLDYVFVGEIVQTDVEEYAIQTFSLAAFGEIVDDIQYGMPGGPCEQVVKGGNNSYPNQCLKIFPDSKTITQLNVEGYIGYPLYNSEGKTMGLITVMHQDEIKEVAYTESLIKIAAKRTEMELERIKYEKILEKKNMELERQNSELASFSFVASHDLQEPLRKITTFTSRLKEKYMIQMPEDAKTYLTKIEESSTRMAKLIWDLLEYSRLINDVKMFVKTDLNEILKNVINDFELMIEQKNAVVKFDNLLTIEAIPLHINQLFYNILSNALKFSREDATPTIDVSCRILTPEDITKMPDLNVQLSYCEIKISDNGIGFEEKYNQQIFVIFQRLNQRNQYEGTGIGLAICKKIVDNHNGKIFVQSKLNEGATFHIILPIYQLKKTYDMYDNY